MDTTKQDWKKYFIVFIITSAIFGTAFAISSWADDNRINEIRSLQDSVALNILSSETQFNLLKSAACEDLFSSDLGQELGKMADRLSYMDSIGRGEDSDLITLKRYYSLLEIKDYLLIKSATQCKEKPITILFFYGPDCRECEMQGNVLTYIRQNYPGNMRIYSFDYNLDLSALKTLANIQKVNPPLPVLVINNKVYNGFRSIEELEKIVPELIATSTKNTGASSSTQPVSK